MLADQAGHRSVQAWIRDRSTPGTCFALTLDALDKRRAAPMTSQNCRRRAGPEALLKVLEGNQLTTAAAWKPFLTNAGDTPKCC